MKRLASAAIALTMLAGPAFAGPRDHSRNQWHNDNSQYQSHRSDHPHWSRGDRLPDQYWQTQYVVTDWRGHHLRLPGHGRHWVRVNNQYILVAIGSGLIVDAIINGR